MSNEVTFLITVFLTGPLTFIVAFLTIIFERGISFIDSILSSEDSLGDCVSVTALVGTLEGNLVFAYCLFKPMSEFLRILSVLGVLEVLRGRS